MKKFTTLLITLCLAMSIMTACGKSNSSSTESGEATTTEATEIEATRESEETENIKNIYEKVGEGAEKSAKHSNDDIASTKIDEHIFYEVYDSVIN